jgi:hypothetical protein
LTGWSNSARGSVALLQPGVAEDRDAVAERHRLDLVMGDVDGRHAEARLQLGDVRAHLDAQLRVEVGERLVHQEHLRLAHDRTPHRHALALAAGELPWLAVEVGRELELRGDLPHARLALGLRDARDPQREADVGGHREVGVERVVLEHHRDVAALGRVVADVAAADPDRAGVDLLEAGEHPQRGRLARARRADEDHQLAVGDLQVQRVDRGHVAARVGARGLLEADLSHGRPPRW